MCNMTLFLFFMGSNCWLLVTAKLWTEGMALYLYEVNIIIREKAFYNMTYLKLTFQSIFWVFRVPK